MTELFKHQWGKKGKKGWTETGIMPIGDDVKELRRVLRDMLKATKRNPVFDFKTGKRIKEKKK